MSELTEAIRMLGEAGKADALGEYEAARDRYLAAKKLLEAAEASPARDMSLITCLLHLSAALVSIDSSQSPMPFVEDALRLAQQSGRTLLAGRGLTVLAGRQVRAGFFQAAREMLALSNELLANAGDEDALHGLAWNLILEAQMRLLERDPHAAADAAEKALGMLDDDESAPRLAATEVLRQAQTALEESAKAERARPRRRKPPGNGNGTGAPSRGPS
jgi:hypothetical protein